MYSSAALAHCLSPAHWLLDFGGVAPPPTFARRAQTFTHTDDAINNFNFQIITNLCGNFTYFVHCSAVAVFVSLDSYFTVIVLGAVADYEDGENDDEDACYTGYVLLCSMFALYTKKEQIPSERMSK